MVGHNLDEGLEFMDPFAQDEARFEADLRFYDPTITDAAIKYIANKLYPPIFNGSYPYVSPTGRMDRLITEAFFTCNTNWLATAAFDQTYSYIFSVPPSLHGDDIPYTYYNSPNSAAVKNDTLAQIMQRYFTRFAEVGDPNAPGVPFFPVYGENQTCLNLNLTSVGTIKDNAANERCTWWQKGLYF
jgi:carboxylesterase type B